jgi:hypothetical protein
MSFGTDGDTGAGGFLENFPLLVIMAAGAQDLDLSAKTFFANEEVLDPDEQRTVQDAIAAYNTVIVAAASGRDDTLAVPLGQAFAQFSPTDMALKGGIFSLDGIHPLSARALLCSVGPTLRAMSCSR